MSDYYLPRETGKLVDASLQRCQNLGLILDKYPTQLAVQRSEGKSAWLKEIQPDSHIDEQLAKQVYTRWLNAMQAIHASHFNAHTDWRMVVGLGGETVLETDLTLHHIYGIPFIPGSALKGLTRAYVTGEVEEHKSSDIDKDDEIVQRIFGSQQEAGSVIFFDAMPVNADFAVSLDIMNAHYPDYYGEKKPPTNDQNPNPITFLTISNATFSFALAPRRPDDPQHVKDVQDVQVWLQQALRNYGVGGKTSAGYGSLTVVGQTVNTQSVKAVESITTPADPEMSRVESYVRELEVLKNSDVAGRINGFYQRWQQTQSNEARNMLAKAIIEKVRRAGREKASADKAWYKDLREFLDKSNQ